MRGGEGQAAEVPVEKAAEENVNNTDEKGEGEGWKDGDEDDYSDEEYDDTDVDEHEEDNAATEKGTGENQPLGVDDSAETDTIQGTSKEGPASSACAELDRGGKNDDVGRGAGDGASRPGGQGINAAHNRETDDFATGNDYTISEVPVYLSGGKKARARSTCGSVCPKAVSFAVQTEAQCRVLHPQIRCIRDASILSAMCLFWVLIPQIVLPGSMHANLYWDSRYFIS